MTPAPSADLAAAFAAALPDVARDVEEFVASAGWDQPPTLFALVPTAELLAAEPAMTGQVDPSAPLTPVAQEPLPHEPLDVALGSITWPPAVVGCALAQEIVVLPPDAQSELTSTAADDSELLRRLAAEHPSRREARLVAAVLRDGSGACVLRLRGDGEIVDELVEHPDLAPNLLDALSGTFDL